jgi:hypothetical protein
MEAKIRNGNLVITLPLEKPRPSSSKKTLIVASSHGVRRSTARMDGEIVCVTANAFVYPSSPDEKNEKKSPAKQKR